MNSNDAFSRIEDPQTAATLTIASNLRTFFRAATKSDAVQFLARQKSDAGMVRRRIERTEAITRLPIDTAFRHPFDAALAIYLWILASVDGEAARKLGNDLSSRFGTSLWWSAMVIRTLNSQTSARIQVDLPPVLFTEPPADTALPK